MGLGARAAAKKSNRQSSKSGGPLHASPAMLRRAAKKPSAWDNVMGEVGAFFKPAGVLYKNVQDYAHSPTLPNGQAGGSTDAYSESLKASRERPAWQKALGVAVSPYSPSLASMLGYDVLDNPVSNVVRALPEKAIPKAMGAYNSLADKVHQSTQHPAGAINPMLQTADIFMNPLEKWKNLREGVSSSDGDLNSVLGSRGQEMWQGLQEDADRVGALDKQEPYVTRAARAVLPDAAAQYFDPNSEDVASAYEKAGYDPMTSLAGALSNPLEWLGAESGGELAGKLKDAGKLRKAVNTAGRLMDPTQLAVDAAAKGVNKARGIDWSLPGKKPLPPEELARRAGVDPEELKAYIQAEDAIPAEATPAPDPFWGELTGSATRDRIQGLLDEATPGYYDNLARNVPDAHAPSKAYEANVGGLQQPVEDAAFNPPVVPHSSMDGLWSDVQPEPRAATIPGQEDAFLLDQALRAADEYDAVQQFQREQEILGRAKEAQLGRKLNELTPSILPQGNIEDALRWLDTEVPRFPGSLEDALKTDLPATSRPGYARPVDPLLALGEPSQGALDAALRTPRRWSDLLLHEGDAASQARQVAPSLPIPRTEMDSLLAQHTPSALPSSITDEALKWLGPVDNGGVVGHEAEILGRAGGASPVEAMPGFVEPMPKDIPGAGSSALGMVDDGTPPRLGQKPSRTLASGLKLYSNPLDPSVLFQAGKAANDAIGKFFAGVEGKVNNAVGAFVDSKRALRQIKYGLKRVFSENYGRVGAELGNEITRMGMRENAINRMATETVHAQLNLGTAAQRETLQNYMNKSLPRAEAIKILGKDMVESADGVRYLMDDAGTKYFSSLLEIEPKFLREASQQEKALMAQIYETFNKKQTHVGKDPKTGESINLTRKQVLDNARVVNDATGLPYHSEDTIQRAVSLIDGAMQRLQEKGFVKDGRVVDMALSMPTWVANLGKYEPRLYKLIEYGVDLSSPTAMQDFVQAIEARHQATTDMLNELNRAQGKPEVKPYAIPDDLRRFLLAQKTGRSAWSKEVAEEAGRFMKRKDLSQEMRDILGPMVNPAYTYTKGVQHVHRAENIAKMRRWVANNESLVSRNGETIEEFMKRTGTDEKDIAYDFSSNPQYASQVGPLAGRFIHRDAADLMAVTGVVPHAFGAGDLDRWKQWSRAWLAVNKVILNPASHFRQSIQNTLSLYTNLGARAAVDMWGSIKDVKNKSQAYLEARNAGLLSAGHDPALYEKIDLDTMPEFDFSGSDLALNKLARHADVVGATVRNAMKAKRGAQRVAAKVSNFAGEMFSAVDDLAKMAAFKHYRAHGYEPVAAAEQAMNAVYSGTGRSRYQRGMAGMNLGATYLDRGARNKMVGAAEMATFAFMSPFHGATQFLWEHGVKNLAGVRNGHWMPMTDPARAMRTYTLMGSAYMLNELARNHNGVTAEEESKQKPDTMRGLAPNSILLPNEVTQLISPDGSMDWFNHGSLTPWGQMTQGKYDVKRGRMTNLADNFVKTFVPGAGLASRMNGQGDNFPINPLMKPMVEQLFNQDMFTGRQIVNPNDSAADQFRPRLAHLWRSYLPPLAPNPAGLLEAMHHVPGRMDDAEQWGEFARAGVQGLATDSGHQFSKLLAGAANSVVYALLGEKIRDSRRILDYQGRDQYLAAAMIDFFGLRIESKNALVNEVAQQRMRAKKAMGAEMLKNARDASRNMAPKEKAEYMRKHMKAIQEMEAAQPSLRWYEAPQDTFGNVLKAAQSLYDRGVQMFDQQPNKPEEIY